MERRCSASLGWNYSEVQFLYTHMYPEGDDIGGSMGHTMSKSLTLRLRAWMSRIGWQLELWYDAPEVVGVTTMLQRSTCG